MRANLPYFRETEDLKPAAIGEDGSLPIHERMQTASFANDLQAWTNIKVVSVAQNDLCPHFLQLTRIERFDACLCANGHKHRRVDHPVRGGQLPESRLRRRIGS